MLRLILSRWPRTRQRPSYSQSPVGSTVHSVNATGPSRAVTIAATEIIPGGQSAVLGSPLYASQLGRWLTNNYHALPVNLAAATAASPTVTEFAP